MKSVFIIALLFATIHIFAQNKTVASGVYTWSKPEVEQGEKHETSQIIEGSTRDLEYFEVQASSISPGKKPQLSYNRDSMEEVIIVKKGKLEVTLGNEHKILGPGSVVVILPGDKHEIYNAGDTSATYYTIKFKARKPLNKDRGISAGGSFMIDFDKLEFNPHDKGGLWSYYRRATAMFNYTEMHVTKLNGHIKSHEPHTHGASEIVLMISGNSEMQIADKFYKATAGDLYYLESGVLHAIQNTSDEPCMYLAFQWE